MMRDNGGWEMFRMIEIEKYPCNDKREAEKRECEVMKDFRANMNMIFSYVSEEDKRNYIESHKEERKIYICKYREKNVEFIKDKKKEYHERNKDKIKEQKKHYRILKKTKKKIRRKIIMKEIQRKYMRKKDNIIKQTRREKKKKVGLDI